MAKSLKKRDPMQHFSEKQDFSNKKRPKRDPKSGLGLLRDPGLPKRDPVGSSAVYRTVPATTGLLNIYHKKSFTFFYPEDGFHPKQTS